MSVTVTVEKVGAAFALIKCHHRPEAEYEFTGEFLGLSHELKFAGKNLRELREGANKRGNSSRLTQSFHFFMFEPIFSPVNALNQPI